MEPAHRFGLKKIPLVLVSPNAMGAPITNNNYL